MQTLYKDEAITIAPNLDGYLLSDFQHTLGDLSDGFWLERCATMFAIANFSRLIMLRFRLNVRQRATKGNNTLSLRDVSVLPEILEPKPKRIDVPISVGSRSAMSALLFQKPRIPIS